MLVSARVKLVWAGRQLKKAQRISNRFLKTDFYTVAEENDGKERLFARVTEVRPMPNELALYIGDAVHNMRSALDHVAFAFAKPADPIKNQVAFPTNSVPGEFRDGLKRRLPGVTPEVLALFEKYQPYNNGKIPETNLLAGLTSLNNWDKHKTLAITWAGIDYLESEFRTIGHVEILETDLHQGKLEVGTILANLKIGERAPGSKVQMHVRPRLFPIFDERMPDVGGKPVFETLVDTGEFIFETIVPDFERLL
jgi:hypothetical protein